MAVKGLTLKLPWLTIRQNPFSQYMQSTKQMNDEQKKNIN